MKAEEILILKISEEIRMSAINDNKDRCELKLKDLKHHLNNVNLEKFEDEVDYYIKRINMADTVSEDREKIIDFTHSIIGRYIGENLSDLTPVDTVIIEESDIDMSELLDRGGPESIVQKNDLLDNNADQIIKDNIISRFDLDMNTEDLNHDLKILLAYLSIELNTILKYTNDTLSNVESKVSDKVDRSQENLDELGEGIEEINENLEQITDSEIEDMPEPPPRVKQQLEKSDDN